MDLNFTFDEEEYPLEIENDETVTMPDGDDSGNEVKLEAMYVQNAILLIIMLYFYKHKKMRRSKHLMHWAFQFGIRVIPHGQ